MSGILVKPKQFDPCDFCRHGLHTTPFTSQSVCSQLCDNRDHWVPFTQDPCLECATSPEEMDCFMTSGGPTECPAKKWWDSLGASL